MSSRPTVTAVLTCRDGARWLPTVLEALEAQTRPPDRLVAVDTGSTDASPSLLEAALGPEAVVDAPENSSYGAAVDLALGRAARLDPGATDWIWLLHDDSAPTPETLQVLLAAAELDPAAGVLGPKICAWPASRRLLEVGVTIGGTGRRETGLERGEHDQGQHQRTRQTLAVNTAGMLVRRDLFDELDGFDERLPIFGNDIDFGWRAARAGHRSLVVPDARLFHVEAAHRGVRTTSVTTQRFRRTERSAALYTLLANCSPVALPFLAVRLLLGSLVRALGFLTVRAPGEARDETAALVRTYLRPDRVVAGRRARRRTAKVPPHEVRHLLAPPWLPYRHGLDLVTDLGAAALSQAGGGAFPRLLRSPAAAGFAVLVLLAVIGARGVLGTGMLSGGALLPAPDSAFAWWETYLASWHEQGLGSSTPAPPYLLPLAVIGTVLGGNAWLVVDVLFILATPLAAWGGYRFLTRVSGSGYASAWGAVTYGLLPVLSGAASQGRLGTVAASVILPWLAHAALFLHPAQPTDRRWRASWRTGGLLALLAAFVPLAWLVAVVLALATIGAMTASGVATWRRPTVWGPVLASVLVVVPLLLPWSVQSLRDGPGPVAWLFEAGVTGAVDTAEVTGWGLVLGRPGGPGAAPYWIGIGLAVAAVAALLRADTRRRVLRPWAVLTLAVVTAALLTGWSFELGGAPTPVWPGFLLLLAQAGAVWAVVLAAAGISGQFAGSSFGWRQPVALLVAGGALLTPVAGLVWWATAGIAEPLDRRAVDVVPAYMVSAVEEDSRNGVLLVRGQEAGGPEHQILEYQILRGDGRRLGDDAVTPGIEAQESFSALVQELVTAPRPADVDELSRHGVGYVYAASSVPQGLSGTLDSASGLEPASAVDPGARAWQLDRTPSAEALPAPEGDLRPVLLGLQALVVVVVIVLAAPTRRVRS